MTRHYAIESDNGIWTETVPVCGHNFRRRKSLTDDPALVDCPACRELCGFDEAPLRAAIERDLRFTMEMQARRAA